MSLYFFNTLSRSLEEFRPIDGKTVKLYTCGPTVYNFAHIGNFRAYLFEDLLRRTLEFHGYKVIQVMNLTDVDDKTIRNSRNAGVALEEYTRKFKDAFFDDIATLKIEKAEFYPEATKHIPEMIAIIEILIQKGFAYRADDASIYFSVAKFADYGKLSKIDMENQIPGQRVRNDEYAKDAIADFALWKAWDEADGDVFWESPWGRGRPGWHIECSAMSMKYLGTTFDIHTGGIDNMFPHHEDEIAQSESANGCRFVNYWLHCEHLIVDGQKMAKSLGNFFTLRDLLAKGYSGREIRWALLGTHYRKKLNFSIAFLDAARNTLKKFDSFLQRLDEVRLSDKEGDDAADICEKAISKFKNGIFDDLNVSEAIAAIYYAEKETNKLIDNSKLSSKGAANIIKTFKEFDKIFAVFFDAATEEPIPDEIQALVRERIDARKRKDFRLADEIRQRLHSAGWTIEDTPKGQRIKKI